MDGEQLALVLIRILILGFLGAVAFIAILAATD